MKRILVLCAFIMGFSGIFAQESVIQKDMQFFSETLKIEDSQRAALSKIIIRKHADLEAIASLRDTDEARFREKRRNVYSGVEGSIKMLLNEEQRQHWQSYKRKARIANAEKTQALRAKNANKQDILDAQAGIPN